MNQHQYSPKQFAYAKAIEALYSEYNDCVGDTGRVRSVRAQLAKLHNKLLEQSKLDGLPLDENT